MVLMYLIFVCQKCKQLRKELNSCGTFTLICLTVLRDLWGKSGGGKKIYTILIHTLQMEFKIFFALTYRELNFRCLLKYTEICSSNIHYCFILPQCRIS